MMIPTALYPIEYYFNSLEYLTAVELPNNIDQKRGLFSKGKVYSYRMEGIEAFNNLTVKGLHLYHYDFGIVYPEKEYVYPIFFYQVIIAPQRILALVHYACNDKEKANRLAGIEELLALETQYEEFFIKEFKSQSFIADDLLSNKFNGLIRTTEIDKAYEAITLLFSQWHKGMLQQGKSQSEEEIRQYQNWFKDFRTKFYKEDYGFLSTKRYLGGKWTKKVFEDYLFKI